jgi:hypothetical protein
MTAFQIQTFVPSDGNLSITLPEQFREVNVELFVSRKEVDAPIKMMSEAERLALLYPFGENLHSERAPMTREERLAWVEKFAGSLQDVDYSDLREETDREI